MSDEARGLIERAVASMPPLCDGLIDQGRFIGSDPVGHACGAQATTCHRAGGLRWRVCERCASWLGQDNGRVTLPTWRAQIDSPSEERS